MKRAPNPLDNFQIDRNSITFLGKNVQRPECILVTPDGSLWVTDPRGGVLQIQPNGSQTLIAPAGTDSGETFGTDPADWRDRYRVLSEDSNSEVLRTQRGNGTAGKSLPNGLAFAPNGDIYVANVGLGRLERLTRSGKVTVLLDNIDGEPIGQLNFVLSDSKGRLWLTIPAREKEVSKCIRPDFTEGRIALYENGKARIVADGIHFTNEARLDAKEEWLYFSETCGPCVSRMRVLPNGDLVDREIFGPKDHGALIDGITFDSYGNLWGTHVFADQIFAITPEGELKILLDDAPPTQSKRLMEAFYKGQITRDIMMECRGTIAPWMTSIAFGGDDLKTVYVGSIFGTSIATFRSPVSGLPLEHWK